MLESPVASVLASVWESCGFSVVAAFFPVHDVRNNAAQSVTIGIKVFFVFMIIAPLNYIKI